MQKAPEGSSLEKPLGAGGWWQLPWRVGPDPRHSEG